MAFPDLKDVIVDIVGYTLEVNQAKEGQKVIAARIKAIWGYKLVNRKSKVCYSAVLNSGDDIVHVR